MNFKVQNYNRMNTCETLAKPSPIIKCNDEVSPKSKIL